MLCPTVLLSSCKKNESTEPAVPSSPVASPTVEESTPESPSELPPDLPSSSTLAGTKHLPIPDHQGSIGSCTSEGITYTQFTVAVSQFINATNPDSNWDPSSGNDSYIFSPKFTYNYAGPNTEYAYKVLMDNGCLPFSLSSFYKYRRPAGQMYQNPSVLDHDQTRSWDVSKGLMEKALKYRLTGFEENDFTATQNGQLTVGTDMKLFYKVKDALARGNSVTICGWPIYFQHGKLTAAGAGSIASEGDSVVWSGMVYADGGASGNHCVSIIGYDDDITYNIAGVELKGAFQIMDSYANGPTDIYYIMYDAFNLVSEHDILNTKDFYSRSVALSVEGMNFQFGISATENQVLTFTPTGKTLTFNQKEYPTYTIGSPDKNIYLSFDGQSFTKSSSANAKTFALIPYSDASSKQDKDYEGGYLVAMADDKGGIKGYLGTEVNTNNATVRFYANTSAMEKICFSFSDMKESGAFDARITVSKDMDVGYVRTGTIYRFSFIYWDKHIQVGNPELMVEAQISMVERENLYMALTRTDKNGNTLEYTPASIDIRYSKNFHPELEIKGPVSFSGKENPTKAETGYFTFGYHVLDDFGKAASYDQFIWGILIKGAGAKILKLRLLDKNGKELCAVVPDSQNCAPETGKSLRFEFRQGAELSTHFGKGVYNFYNVGAKKTLSLQTNNMLFEWRKDTNTASVERSAFRVEYLAEEDCYIIRHGSKDYVFDIAGNDLSEGVTVKMNAPSNQRLTQRWLVILHDDGSISITNKQDPTLFLGYNGTDFCLSKDASNPSSRFIAKVSAQSMRSLDLSFSGKTINATATVPAGYTPSECKLTVIQNGQVVKTLTPTIDGKTLSFKDTLAEGDYLFCLTKDGKAIDNMIACRLS